MYLPPVISVNTLWFVTLHLGSLLAITAGKNLPVRVDYALQQIREGICSTIKSVIHLLPPISHSVLSRRYPITLCGWERGAGSLLLQMLFSSLCELCAGHSFDASQVCPAEGALPLWILDSVISESKLELGTE